MSTSGAPKQSPIRDRPLRLPGQSLTEQRDSILEDQLVVPLVAAVLLLVLAGWEWWRYLHPQKPNPLFASAMALGAAMYLLWKFFRVRR
jgi:hypothetical protein